ncbi:MAG: orotate phosphoribosyltransferase [Lachnospiraceae bacterium]
MENRIVKFYAKDSNKVAIHAVPGHFSTGHSHINYYINITSLKSRISEAREVAKLLAGKFTSHMIVDTIVCMDGMEVVGAFLAEELEKKNIMTITNTHETVYVVAPEFNSNNQMIFRDNSIPAIEEKHILLLSATTTTGDTIRQSLECIQYYNGTTVGVVSVFSTIAEVEGFKIESAFDQEDVPGYAAYSPQQCPFCKKGHRLEAMVNGFGYSKI